MDDTTPDPPSGSVVPRPNPPGPDAACTDKETTMRSPHQSAPEPTSDHRTQRAFRKGDRVEVTKWTPHPRGRVTNVHRGSVFVQYDNSFLEDELDPTDVQTI